MDGEWSLAQTLRHLVMATDTWVRGAAQGVDAPYHPIGVPNAEYATDGYDPAVFSLTDPTWSQVLDVRADRQRIVRELLDGATPDELARTVRHPWAPTATVTVGSCVRTVLEEEWEHLRYARRDLDTVEHGTAG